VSSSVGGRVSPMMAKLSEEMVPPPGPTLPELEDELDALVVDELDAVVDELLDELEVPEHFSPQIEVTSPTQVVSQSVLQQ
jgi:hypothetical protein